MQKAWFQQFPTDDDGKKSIFEWMKKAEVPITEQVQGSQAVRVGDE